MTTFVLIAQIAGQRVGFHAETIEAVVDLTVVKPVPRAQPHILGLSAIRSEVVTVIDCALVLGGAPAPACGRAIVVIVEGTRYALRVDVVEDVVHGHPIVALAEFPVADAWRRIATGRIDMGDTVGLIVDPSRIVAGADHATSTNTYGVPN